MLTKSDYMAVLRHETPVSVPGYTLPVRFGVGLMDAFEKGPAGGGLDGFGVLWESTPDGPVPSTRSFVLTDVTKWREQVRFPDLDAIDWAAKAKRELADFDREKQVLEYGFGNGTFERMLALMGYEELIVALEDEPEACHEFIDAYDAYRLRQLEHVARCYQPEVATLYDDVAFGKGPFLSFEQYREFIKPSHAKFNAALRERGIIPFNHCCGRAEYFIEDFIEEGAAAWTSCQPMNDIASLVKKYGDKIVLIGGFNSQGAPGAAGASEAERRAEVRRVIDEYAANGSFIVGNFTYTAFTDEDFFLFLEQIVDELQTYGDNYYARKGIK